MSQPPPAARVPEALPTLIPRVQAPPRWRCIDLISDLHLQSSDRDTFCAWQRYLDATQADALFILGDLFEVWVGDDQLDPHDGQPPRFEAECQQLLAQAARHMSVYLMHGNRDFLLDQRFARGASATLLSDPTRLAFDSQGWLLSHGDALCLADTDYQQFRAQVRSNAWRDAFLAKPLDERQQLARGLRARSEVKKSQSQVWVDIDPQAACGWLDAADAQALIHGHTHQPRHDVLRPDATKPLQRWVLSDWDARANPPRHQVLRLQLGQAPQRLDVSGL